MHRSLELEAALINTIARRANIRIILPTMLVNKGQFKRIIIQALYPDNF